MTIKNQFAKITINDCISVAEKHGGKCNSTEYVNSNTKMDWECKIGHRWPAIFLHIKRNHWCPYCAGRPIITVKDCALLAESHDGEFLSSEYVNAYGILSWKCHRGHIFSSNYHNIKQGHWCKECGIGKVEAAILSWVRELFIGIEVVHNFVGFDWLYNKKTKRTQELDIYVPDLKLAIEYDGRQHFEPVCFGGISKERAFINLKRTRQLDRLKNKKIQNHKQDIRYFIRIDYREKIEKEYLVNIFKEFGIIKEEEKINYRGANEYI